jgi:glutamyl-tRNA synthetase
MVVSRKGKSNFLISKRDVVKLKENKKVRFMELFNLELKELKEDRIEATFHSEAYEKAKQLRLPLIHWIPTDTGIPCEVIMPNATITKGMAEEESKNLSKDKIIQFERFGFVRINSIEKKIIASFAHK